MPGRLRRYYGAGYLHFITSSCYQRRPLLGSEKNRDLFLRVLEAVRRRYDFVVVGYVVMPAHIHLLLSEPERGNRRWSCKPSNKVLPGVFYAVGAGVRTAVKLRFGRVSAARDISGNGVFTILWCGARASESRSCAICIAIR